MNLVANKSNNQSIIIKDSVFNIQDFNIKFSVFSYSLLVDGEFEINHNFKVPAKSLFYNLTLPNQKIEKIKLIESNKRCKENVNNCKVYTSNAILSLSNDKFFSRKIYDSKVGVFINFGIDPTNITFPENYDFTIWTQLINKINSTNFKRDYKYFNSIDLNNLPYYDYDKKIKKVKINSNWTVSKYKPISVKEGEELYFYLNNYTNLNNQIIENFLQIKNYKNTKISFTPINNSMNYYLQNQSESKEFKIPVEDVKAKYDFLDKIYKISYSANTWFDNNLLQKNNFYNNNKIFIPKKSFGEINHEGWLNINDSAYYLNWTNNFNYKNNFIFNEQDNLTISYEPLNIKYFDINKFELIEF